MLNNIIQNTKSYIPNPDVELISRAYDFAGDAYHGHVRLNGDTLLEHAVAVANHLIRVRVDSESIAAALLHDTLHKVDVEREELEKEFGAGVTGLVDGVHRLQNITTTVQDENGRNGHNERLRHLILAAGKDVRVILIRLAEKLHNLETSDALSSETRKLMTNKIIQIYAPLAENLGVGVFKRELENQALRNIEPDIYQTILNYYENKDVEEEQFLAKTKEDLQSILEVLELEDTVFGRVKHHYSVYRKFKSKNENNQYTGIYEYLNRINDKYAFTILVESEAECYRVLDAIHQQWEYDKTEFDDYIMNPKPNGYRSLQTMILVPPDERVEIQIRTHEMHEYNEFGPASHVYYKELGRKKGSTRMAPDAKIALIKNLMQWHETMYRSDQNDQNDQKDLGMKIKVFENRVFVFTPKGDLHDLPRGATPIDFAYAVHTEIGDALMRAKVNDKVVALDYELKNGDVCEIMTGNRKGPSRDWLRIAKTRMARSKIRSTLTQAKLS